MRALHVEGKEIHSVGPFAGFFFANRSKPDFVENPTNGDRWLWYAVNGQARLWSGKDALTVTPAGNTFVVQINGSLNAAVQEFRGIALPGETADSSTVRFRAKALAVEDPATPLTCTREVIQYLLLSNDRQSISSNRRG